jgi:flagellar basal-body rod modification protein FlgD
MPVEPTVTSATTAAISAARRGSRNDLGKDDFLQLLIAQLRNQDPLKPMEDREFIVQLAQFRTLEQMEKMTASLDKLLEGQDKLMQAQAVALASGLLGKTVATKDGVAGAVSKVLIAEGKPKLEVEGERVGLDAVTEVR